jgi:plasmid stabilization system protein ParE
MIDAVTQRPRARLDLLEQFVYPGAIHRSWSNSSILEQFIYLGEKASVEVAERYFAAVAETSELLVTQPRSGAPYESGIEKLAGLRRMPVKGFGSYLLFYMPRARGIDVVRVLRASRDIENIFGSEET